MEKYKLIEMITCCRSLIAMSLLKIEDKVTYIDRILEMKDLVEIEIKWWKELKNICENTGALTKADLMKVFGWNKLDQQSIDIVIGSDTENEIDIHISKFEKCYKRLGLINMINQYKEHLYNSSRFNVDELIERLNDEVSIKNMPEDTWKNLKKAYDDKLDSTKISTCVKVIDNFNAGFRKGTVNAIMGYTGSYKTLYCTNVSYAAIKQGLNVCYVSLEIGKAEMYYNFLSRYSNEDIFDKKISHSEMKFKELNIDDEKYLFENIVPSFDREVSKHLVIIDESDFETNNASMFNELFRNAENKFIEQTGKGVDMVVIDHLNLLKFSDGGMNDYSKINHWMSYFRKNCKNFIRRHKQVCILVAVQSSRDGYDKAKYNSGQYSLTGAAEGNEIERSSENVLAIYTDSNLKQEKLAKIQLIKGRNCGEMEEPVLITVDPKYYIVSDYTVESKSEEQEEIDVFNIGKVSGKKSSKLQEKYKDELSQLGVHFEKQ